MCFGSHHTKGESEVTAKRYKATATPPLLPKHTMATAERRIRRVVGLLLVVLLLASPAETGAATGAAEGSAAAARPGTDRMPPSVPTPAEATGPGAEGGRRGTGGDTGIGGTSKGVSRPHAAEGRGARTGRGGVVSSQASGSLARIKREYKEAVADGIAYDWVNRRRIVPRDRGTKEKKRRQAPSSQEEEEAPGGPDRKQQQHQQQQIQPQEEQLIWLGPLTTNLRHWHFSFRGAGGLYGGGVYHGRILLPRDYPMSPPRVQLWTPSGRFRTHEDICLSASAYHPESWTPRWTVAGLVRALRHHMLTPPTEVGGMTSTADRTLRYARESRTWAVRWRPAGGTTGPGADILVDHAELVGADGDALGNDEGATLAEVASTATSLRSTVAVQQRRPGRDMGGRDGVAALQAMLYRALSKALSPPARKTVLAILLLVWLLNR